MSQHTFEMKIGNRTYEAISPFKKGETSISEEVLVRRAKEAYATPSKGDLLYIRRFQLDLPESVNTLVFPGPQGDLVWDEGYECDFQGVIRECEWKLETERVTYNLNTYLLRRKS